MHSTDPGGLLIAMARRVPAKSADTNLKSTSLLKEKGRLIAKRDPLQKDGGSSPPDTDWHRERGGSVGTHAGIG
jgi:hypothetical protein